MNRTTRQTLNAARAVEALLPLLPANSLLLDDMATLFLHCFPSLRKTEVEAELLAAIEEGVLISVDALPVRHVTDPDMAIDDWLDMDPEWPALWQRARYNLLHPPHSMAAGSSPLPLSELTRVAPSFMLLLLLLGGNPCPEKEWKEWHPLLQGQRFSVVFYLLGIALPEERWLAFPPILQPHLIACILQELTMDPKMPADNRQVLMDTIRMLADKGSPAVQTSAAAALGLIALLSGGLSTAQEACAKLPEGMERLCLQAWADWQMGRIDLQQAYERLPRPLPDVSGCMAAPFWMLCLHRLQPDGWQRELQALFPPKSKTALLPFAPAYRAGCHLPTLQKLVNKGEDYQPLRVTFDELLQAMLAFIHFGASAYKLSLLSVIGPDPDELLAKDRTASFLEMWTRTLENNPMLAMAPDLIACTRHFGHINERLWDTGVFDDLREVGNFWFYGVEKID